MNKSFTWIKGMLITGLLFTSVGCANLMGMDRNDLRQQNYRTARVANDTGYRDYQRSARLNYENRVGRNGDYTLGPNGRPYANPGYNVRNTTNNAVRNLSNNTLAQGARVADDIADAVTDLPAVQSSSVLVTARNAYVAVMLKPGRGGDGRLTDRVKKQIADRVRDVDPSIQKVYVSTNPDFVKQMQNYANDLRNGRPLSGLINNIADTINRTFPEAK